MNKIKVVSFYTQTGVYPELSKRLEKSCQKYGVPITLVSKPDLGSWVKNCGYKSSFILEELNNTPDGECIVWVDSDGRFESTPYLLIDTEADFGVRAEPGGRKKTPAGREEISLPKHWPSSLTPAWFNSGTIFLRKCPKVIELCTEWRNLTQLKVCDWDQWTLQEAWSNTQPKTEWLPREYCQIDKLHGRDRAVILHDLASTIQGVNRK
jgi:hypothetical protein